MTYKSLIIIALILTAALIAAPVAAAGMWNGDNWVDSHHNDKCTKVTFDPQTGNTNCYNENVGSLADIKADPNTYSGRVDVIIKTHSNALNPLMYLVNNVNQNVSETIVVNNDGLNTISDLPPGEFILTLDRYNLEDETARFTIATGQQEPARVVFEGQGASAAPARVESAECKPGYKFVGHNKGYFDLIPAHTEKIWSAWSFQKPANWDQIPDDHKERMLWHNQWKYRTATDRAVPEYYQYVGYWHGDYIRMSCDHHCEKLQEDDGNPVHPPRFGDDC